MAVDSVAKRMSAFGFGGIADILPAPDGTIAQGDRAHLMGLYSGIAPVAGSIAATAQQTLTKLSQRTLSLGALGQTLAKGSQRTLEKL